MASEHEDTLIVNRLNGGRLTVQHGSLVDGRNITVARYSKYDKSHPQRWTTKKVGEHGGNDVITIEQSDENGTFCIDAGDDAPEPDSSSYVKLKEADGSDRQKWIVRNDIAIPDGKLVKFVSYVDTTLAMVVQHYEGNWDYVVLTRSFSTDDRLWYFNYWSYEDIIPE